MALSMYQASIPTFIHALNNLIAILEKGLAHAEAKKIDPSVFLNSRLFPDMLPLTRQIHIATDGVKGCAARLAGQTPPVFEDNETTFAELIARLRKTIDYLNTFNAAQIDGTEEKEITLKIGVHEMKFLGQPYLLNFVVPNFYFHVATAYNILRHNGVEIGKQDYLGKIQ
ncbi:MAG TPA: DUF1993 domain-containing protein [Spongiibacteraceae bacterium]|nr:DUF1993 domain-containing protein [Spongiibacteraceae bacterium]